MKTLHYNDIATKVAGLCCKAAYDLPDDVLAALENALASEQTDRARSLLKQCVSNARLASEKQMPICQDTGFAVFFVDLGQDVHIEGGLLVDAINEGVAKGYTEGYLRKSIVKDPLYDRTNTGNNTPPVIHINLVAGDKLHITLAPKGAGSENISAFHMFKPANTEEDIIDFVAKTVIEANGNPCPPTIVGVGIGGTFEKAALCAKQALLRPLGQHNSDKKYAKLEQKILDRINASGVGPQGLGGSTTSLAVHIKPYPCHIASLPVAVNINCHAARHASAEL